MKYFKTIQIQRFFLKAILLLLIIFFYHGCENNPNDLGLVFIPSVDTTITRYLDSQTDTMNISSNNYKQFINTFGTKNLLIGNYQGYTSKSMLRFASIGPEFDSATVNSAILTLRYSDYFFKDEMGQTSFNVYRVNNNFNYETVTYDSITSSSIGTVSMGSYTGTPVDTQQINVTLNNQFVKDWLEYAADTSYPVKNYGFMLQPDASSNSIKGFYSYNNSDALIPYITVIYTKNSVTDTFKLVTSSYVSLSDAPASIIPNERFILQNGIAFRNILNFDLAKLPYNVIINNVSLTLHLDKDASFISSTTEKSLISKMILDSAAKKDSFEVSIFPLDSITYTISAANFNAVFQRWNSAILPNLGIVLKNSFEIQNLDNFVFYSPSAADVTKRPRLKITYTPRN